MIHYRKVEAEKLIFPESLFHRNLICPAGDCLDFFKIKEGYRAFRRQTVPLKRRFFRKGRIDGNPDRILRIKRREGIFSRRKVQIHLYAVAERYFLTLFRWNISGIYDLRCQLNPVWKPGCVKFYGERRGLSPSGPNEFPVPERAVFLLADHTVCNRRLAGGIETEQLFVQCRMLTAVVSTKIRFDAGRKVFQGSRPLVGKSDFKLFDFFGPGILCDCFQEKLSAAIRDYGKRTPETLQNGFGFLQFFPELFRRAR